MDYTTYKKQVDASIKDKSYAWKTAIGLQAVDGLKPSKYLIATANKHIKGDITINEAEKLINSYYEENKRKGIDKRTEEADKVSMRIAKILSVKTFNFTPDEYLKIHKKFFTGIYSHAGKIRKYNITKSEWILDGDTVIYGDAKELKNNLEYDLSEERKVDYSKLSDKKLVKHLAKFISLLWQNHVFAEGNTRTTAVFFIKYLKRLGFEVTNDIFEENAWYFRNALVRANYNNREKKIVQTTEYLEKFLENLLFSKKNKLQNRKMHISGLLSKNKKANIQNKKANIEKMKKLLPNMTKKTYNHIFYIYEKMGKDIVFGRSDVSNITKLGPTRASELLMLLLDKKIIKEVKGMGKGKYIFNI